MIIVLLLLAFALPLTTSRLSLGTCPELEGVTEFQLTDYLGTWYELARDKWTPLEYKDCVTCELTQNEDGSIRKLFSLYDLNKHNLETLDGYALYAGA